MIHVLISALYKMSFPSSLSSFFTSFFILKLTEIWLLTEKLSYFGVILNLWHISMLCY